MCLAAHEAMAMGLPVIATPVGELAHSVIRGETGFVIDQPVERSLAAILDDLFANPARLEQYGRAGRDYVRAKFSVENFNAAGFAVLERIRALLPHS
jgi:glycosyltransferase involved in cell wall biosynthesis